MISNLFSRTALHQHADPAQRILGAAALPPDSGELAQLLAADPAPEVRSAAAQRCTDLAALASATSFLAFYTWRLNKESRQMAAALAATDMVLASEQRLHALDGLAAAAAHELGTPLSTIVLVAKELEHELGPDSRYREVIVPPYRFFYRVKEDVVWIVAVWHGA